MHPSGRGQNSRTRTRSYPTLAEPVYNHDERTDAHDVAPSDGFQADGVCQALEPRLNAYTRPVNAERSGCAERTVKRKLEVIREVWLQGES